jgi:hypothetical protein
MTNVSDTSDPEPCFIGVTGVNPGKATAEGGLGLMPVTPMQALSMGGWNESLATTPNGDVHARPPKRRTVDG